MRTARDAEYGIKALSQVVSDLEDLLDEPECDEEGLLFGSAEERAAIRDAMKLLRGVRRGLEEWT